VTNSFRRTLIVLASLVAFGLAACIIGPKHDDPEAPATPTPDTGIAFDTDKVVDTTGGFDSATTPDTVPMGSDTSGGDTDTTSDGCPDGGGDADPSETRDGCGDAVSDGATEGG